MGDELLVRGEIKEFEPATNPGQFDAKSWYFAQNTVCSLGQCEILEYTQGRMSIARALYNIRSSLRESYKKILGDKEARIISAITLGEKSYPEQEWKTAYQEGGIAHVLAISGLHITLIGMALYRLLRKTGLGFLPSATAGGAAILLYTLMTGRGISAVRAAVMFGLWLGSQVWGRKQDMVTSAAVAALVLTVADGGNPFRASFLLSFGSILSLGILLPCMEEQFGIKKIIPRGLLAGIAIWLGTLPVTLYFYCQAAPWGLLVNLAVIPLMGALMTTALVSAVFGLVCVPLGIFLAAPVSMILALFQWLCDLESRLPLSVWVAGRPSGWRIAVYYGILGAAVLAGRSAGKKGTQPSKRKKAFLWCGCLVLCVFLMAARGRSGMQVVCMDVGQGDGSLVQLPTGENCLIDGGSSSRSYLWDNVLSRTVKYYGIRTLDFVFLSHADQDHISGVSEFLEEYETGLTGKNIHGVSLNCLVLPPAADDEDFQNLRELAYEKGITVLRMAAEDTIRRGDIWSIRCLSPDEDTLSADRNQDSMVLRLTYGSFSMLFTGDLEGEGELRLASSGENLHADVLKVGHHGSAKASSAEFLSGVGAAFAIISCGRNNIYGHPSADTLTRLEEAGCRILQTARSGAIILQTDGEKYRIRTFLKAESDGKD